MTALTADKHVDWREGLDRKYACGVDVFHKGAGVMLGPASANVLPCDDTDGFQFVGIAMEKVDNSAGSAGDESITVRTRGQFKLTTDGDLGAASVGKRVYWADDQTVTLWTDTTDAAEGLLAGVITEYVSTSEVWVEILPDATQVRVSLIAGGAAGDHTVDGIQLKDRIVSVIHNTAGALADLTSEFTIDSANTINNDGGTATTSDQLLVIYEQAG